MIEKLKYANHEEWLAIRHKYIGGSDAGAILGFNKYASPYSVWAEKTGKVKPFEGNNATRRGTYLEAMVADIFCDENEKKVQRCNFTIVNSDYPWACANIDRMIVGEDAILECKTTNSFPVSRQFSKGEYPDTWYCQCMHYLAVTGKQKAYLAAYNMIDDDLRVWEIERDDAEIASLMAAEKAFWNKVTSNTPPALDGTEATNNALNEIYAESDPGASGVDLFGMNYLFDQRKLIMDQIKVLDEQKKGLEAQVKVCMGEAEKGGTGTWSVSWKPQRSRSVDWKRLEADGRLPAFQTYITESTSRVLRITEKKSK